MKPRLLTFLNGPPDFETLAPTLARLARRGRVVLDVVAYRGLFRKLPRAEGALRDAAIPFTVSSKLRMKTVDTARIFRADGVFSITDPNLERIPTRRPRAWTIRMTNTRSIFLQHGAFQTDVNFFPEGEADYASDPVLLWEPPGKLHSGLSEATRARVRISGYIKAPMWIPEHAPDPALDEWIARHPRRILVCHSFRFRAHGRRFAESDIDTFFSLITTFAERHPDIGLMIRPHRGRDKAIYRSREDALVAGHRNVVISRATSGNLAGSTIHEALAVNHALIGPATTVTLDAIYNGRPAAVIADELGLYPEAPQIKTADDFEAFVETLDLMPHPVISALEDRFGRLEESLERTAEHIETALGAA